MTNYLANSLLDMMGFDIEPDLVIRWKPHMWWVYKRGETTSHFHGSSDDPDELKAFCLQVWPKASIEIEPRPSASPYAQ